MSDILRDLNQWREIKQAQALEYAGTPEGRGYLVEAVRYKRAFEEIESLRQERDRLLKGEYICQHCGLRKNDEHPTPDF